ncbi:MAG: helix-turn-helix domain-containing protein [Candidatus Latescibacteria bacterium]|nr:helix-turn-helix domain-containing protein [Candidatus Latescibacterota bacterium]
MRCPKEHSGGEQTPETTVSRPPFAGLSHLARQAAKHLGRRPQTVCEGIHRFNQDGPEGLIPNFQSPSAPPLTPERLELLRQAFQKPACQSGLKVARWSSKRVAA